MGYFVKISAVGSSSSYLSSSAMKCFLQTDKRGCLYLEPTLGAGRCPLIEFTSVQPDISLAKLLHKEFQTLEDKKIHSFCRSFSFRADWKCYCIETSLLDSSAFVLAKLSSQELLLKKPVFMLSCDKNDLRIPVFEDTKLSIGSHNNDLIQIHESGVRAQHAEIEVAKSRESLKISEHLGRVETSSCGDVTHIYLKPSKIKLILAAC